MGNFEVNNRYIFIAGGSRGLGKALGIELANRGAHIVLLARGRETLELARKEVLAARKLETQIVDVLAVDLCNAKAVKDVIDGYGTLPDILFCVAGGSSPSQIGFLADLTPDGITSCLESNYYSAVFITQRCLQLWIGKPEPSRTRHIVLISSSAAFVGIPGYSAYTAPKAAIRAFADTLRQELLLYGTTKEYQVHAAFPGTFVSESFLAEQATKPELTKIMEGSNMSDEELLKKTDSAGKIAHKIIAGLEKDHFFITSDWESALILNNMRGPSPRNNWFWDVLLQTVAFLIWPFVSRKFDRITVEQGRKIAGQRSS